MTRILILSGEEGDLNVWVKTIDQLVVDSEDPYIGVAVLTEDQKGIILEAIEDHIDGLSDGLKFELSDQEVEELKRQIEDAEKLEEIL